MMERMLLLMIAMITMKPVLVILFQVEALGVIPAHLLSRLRGSDGSVDDVENPLQVMRRRIEDAKKGTNGRLPDNYRRT